MKLIYKREVTEWNSSEYPVPNHTYIFNEDKQCVGYVPLGDNKARFFNEPSKLFSAYRRKFVKVMEVDVEDV